MRDRDLYATILGLTEPWKVTDVALDAKLELVSVKVEAAGKSAQKCPECGKSCPGYDTRDRRWRHLDTCQYQTILVAKSRGSSVPSTASGRSTCRGAKKAPASRRCSRPS